MDAPGALMSYVAGVAAFVAPCTLVLVPFFLLYLVASTLGPREGGQSNAWRSFSLSRWLAVGFIVAFVLAWSFPDTASSVLRGLRLLERVGGVALVALGLSVAGLLTALRRADAWRLPLGLLLAVLVGATLAAGWTPCVGRTLAHILGITGGPQGLTASVLLGVYGLGLMTPFLALGLATGWATGSSLAGRARPWLAPVAGAGLIAVGVLVFTGNVRDLTAYFLALAPRLTALAAL